MQLELIHKPYVGYPFNLKDIQQNTFSKYESNWIEQVKASKFKQNNKINKKVVSG